MPSKLIQQTISAEDLAKKFHYSYETQAPNFGYETRKESAKPWEEVPEKNRKLMIAVCEDILGFLCNCEAVDRNNCKEFGLGESHCSTVHFTSCYED